MNWVVLLLVALTLLFFTSISPVKPVGPELLINPLFEQGLEGWRLGSGKSEVSKPAAVAELLVDNAPGSESSSVIQKLDAQGLPKQLLLQGEVRTSGVGSGRRSWHEARVELIAYDSFGQGFYHIPYILAGLIGDNEWRGYSLLVTVPEEAVELRLEIGLYHVPGRIWVRGVALHQAEPQTLFSAGKLLLALLWLVAALWTLRLLLQYYWSTPQGWMIALLLLLIVAGILQPQEVKQAIEVQIQQLGQWLGIHLEISRYHHGFDPLAFWPVSWDISKLGHLLGFFLLSAGLFLDSKTRLPSVLIGLLLLAVSTEVVQFFVPGRTPRLSDVVVDMLGVLAGWLSARSIMAVQTRLTR
ncbi:MAG: VanZ family protein [gamma proteobacterium endosymbiont of Lamellibrachia anaximandri]|nr:VanZ family protein [gamma proteobacterium endosymbiont of Lamellibrachia anaximandri]MBL3617053.1 VanZ family protein [gamma proteobacterium endosymbiont of Lamellibrachia anaximandri]